MSVVLGWAIAVLAFVLIVIGVCVFARCEGGDSKWEHVGEVIGSIILVLAILAVMFL